MKKKIFVIAVFLLICSFLLAACRDYSFVELEPVDEPSVVEAEPYPEVSEDCYEPEISLISELAGFWLLSHGTDEEGELIEVAYSDWIIYTIEIREDYTFTWSAYGSLSGELVYVGDNSFEAVNLVAMSEGQTWYPEEDEITISYDPQSGLLRYSRVFKYPAGPTAEDTEYLYQILYYERMKESPFAEGIFQRSLVQVDFATDEVLRRFSLIHICETEYDPGEHSALISNQNAVLWADIILRDFSLISVHLNFNDDDAMYVWSFDNLRTVANEVLPGEAVFVFNHSSGSIPTNGFHFIDGNGVSRYFTFVENMGYPFEPGPYRWLVHEFDARTGQLIELFVS